MEICYATREQVKFSLEAAGSVRTNALIDNALLSSSRGIEGMLRRRFYPERRTIKMDYPNYQYSNTWEYWLDSNEAISAYSLTAGGVSLTEGTHYFLRRGDDKAEPPYSKLEINLDSSATWGGGTSFQRTVVADMLFGYNDTDTSLAGGALVGAINNAVTSLVAAPSGGQFTLGVGALLLIGTERLVVTERSMSTTSQTLQGTIAAAQDIEIVGVTTGSSFATGEVILIDAERMLITDIAGNNLIVERAYDGTTLASHTAGATIYAQRTFTVRRGQLGSTAAAHSNSDPIYVHAYPSLINRLCVLESLALLGISNAYSDQNTTDILPALREEAKLAYGRCGSRIAAI